MECYLMNRDKKVFRLEYNDILSGFDKIYEIYDISFAPLIVSAAKENSNLVLKELNKWFRNRGIPSWRDDLERLLYRLNVDTTDELLNKAYGLSLSDQYWVKPVSKNITHDDINFFDHEFNSADFANATFINDSVKLENINLMTPNNTTDGMLKKSWIIEMENRILVKGGYKNSTQQPLNEFLASLICERLGFDHVKYQIDVINGKLVSKCNCFITKNTELIGAHNVFSGYKRQNPLEDYEYFIHILQKNGIKNPREKIENMLLLDYIIRNVDRHLNNFGIIRDVNTLKWLDIAPIFDNGQSMEILDSTQNSIIVEESGKFFYDIVPFNWLLTVIKDMSRFDFIKLNGIVEIWEETLKRYQYASGMTDEKIYRLCYLLNNRIENLQNLYPNNIEEVRSSKKIL